MLNETKREVFAFTQKVIQYGVLQREVQAQTEVYNLLLKRLHETGVTDQIRVGNASVVDLAEVPTVPVKPSKTMTTLLWPAGRIRVGLCIAWGLTALDTAIHTPRTGADLGFPSSEPSRGSASTGGAGTAGTDRPGAAAPRKPRCSAPAHQYTGCPL